MKVALVHDYLIEFGGAERVLVALKQIWPEATVFTSFYQPERFQHLPGMFDGWQIVTCSANYIPFIARFVSPLRFISPWIFESINLTEYDLVISSCNTYSAKAVITRPETVHLCYLHTPPRALYGYDSQANWRRSVWKKRLTVIPAVGLRLHDFVSAQRPDLIIANSEETKTRIDKYYRRQARVIYPPVKVGEIARRVRKIKINEKGYFLIVSRLLPPKNVDLAVKACTRLKLPLKVVGTGMAKKKIACEAGKTVQFLDEVSDEKLWELYAGCQALIFCAQDEDFGIVPVEAMAAGKPVIALNQGGVRESVIEGKTGTFFPNPTPEDLVKSLRTFKPEVYNPQECFRQALKFDQKVFRSKMIDLVEELMPS